MAGTVDRPTPLAGRAKLVSAFFLAYAALSGLGLVGAAAGQALNADRDPGAPALLPGPSALQLLGFLATPVQIGLVVTFLVWFAAAYRNVLTSGRPAKGSPTSSVLLWLLPVVGLVLAYPRAKAVWDASTELPGAGGPSGPPPPRGRGLFVAWWALLSGFVLLTVLAVLTSFGQAARGGVDEGDGTRTPVTVAELRNAAVVGLLGVVVGMAAALVGLVYVRTTSYRLDAAASAAGVGVRPADLGRLPSWARAATAQVVCGGLVLALGWAAIASAVGTAVEVEPSERTRRYAAAAPAAGVPAAARGGR